MYYQEAKDDGREVLLRSEKEHPFGLRASNEVKGTEKGT